MVATFSHLQHNFGECHAKHEQHITEHNYTLASLKMGHNDASLHTFYAWPVTIPFYNKNRILLHEKPFHFYFTKDVHSKFINTIIILQLVQTLVVKKLFPYLILSPEYLKWIKRDLTTKKNCKEMPASLKPFALWCIKAGSLCYFDLKRVRNHAQRVYLLICQEQSRLLHLLKWLNSYGNKKKDALIIACHWDFVVCIFL